MIENAQTILAVKTIFELNVTLTNMFNFVLRHN